MFATRAAAEKRAQQLKCSGAFAMGEQWMPGQDLKQPSSGPKKSFRAALPDGLSDGGHMDAPEV
jgi:hypothetical protein